MHDNACCINKALMEVFIQREDIHGDMQCKDTPNIRNQDWSKRISSIESIPKHFGESTHKQSAFW